MDKDKMIEDISVRSDRFGNLLVEMMDKYNVINLQQLTEEQVKEYYDEVIKNE